MGDPRNTKKHYTNPRKRWNKARIEEERKLMGTYGLKNKKEIRMLETVLRRKRQAARKLLALESGRGKRETELLQSLIRLGILGNGATLDDVLSITLTQFMERRLQTLVWRKNLANTVKQARQFITHGRIAVGGRKVSCPSYMVDSAAEKEVGYFGEPLKLATKAEKKQPKAAVEGAIADKAKAEEGAPKDVNGAAKAVVEGAADE